MNEATRQIYFNISYHWLMYLLFIPVIGAFIYGFRRKWQFVNQGSKEERCDNWQKRVGIVFKHVFGHVRLFRDLDSGAAHFWIFWGMVLLIIGTTAIVVQADFGFEILYGPFYLLFQSLVLDLVGLLATIGLGYMLVKRYILRPERLASGKSDLTTAGLLLLIMIEGFILEGIRIVATNDHWRAWSPVGSAVGYLFSGFNSESLLMAHRFFWWFHLATAFLWIGSLPFTKIAHSLIGIFNIYFSNLEPKYQAIRPIDFENAEKMGITGPEDFTWKERLDLTACTECGRCQEVCPAYAVQKPLSPRQVILNFRDGVKVEDETIWACTTCRACMEACPVLIDHVPKLINLRRYQVMEESNFPELLQEVSRSLDSRSHPYKGAAVSRLDWCEGLDVPNIVELGEVDVLFWVGCTAAFDPRNQKVAQALTQVMKKQGINFAILGSEEKCCGDVARRMGNEYLYEMIVKENVSLLQQYKFKRIVTTCPHCLHVLGGEYRQFGGEFEVLHHTQLLSELGLQVNAEGFTLHDPCYLGRWSDEYAAPRKILKGMTEMHRNRERSFCCGAGGGNAWLEDTHGGPRINQDRAQQAISTGAKGVCTACPFCLQMLEDGVKAQEGGADSSFLVKDLVELVAESF